MKNLFPGFYKPTDEEFNKMWQECIFAFDANMLLNIYRYTKKTQESFFNILERFKDRIWIPFQVAFEYQNRRERVIEGEIKVYKIVEEKLEATNKALENDLANYKRHASINIDEVFKPIKDGIDAAKKKLLENRQNHPDFSISDPLRERIDALFTGKIGHQYSKQELSNIYAEAEQRFTDQEPPGYKDAKTKPIPERYNDVVIWFQVIEFSKSQRKPLIFITDDRKDDWWRKENGKTISARPELTYEIETKAGVQFYMYQSDQFIEYALRFLDIRDQQAAVNEVVEIRKQDEERETKRKSYSPKSYLSNAAIPSESYFRVASELENIKRSATWNVVSGLAETQVEISLRNAAMNGISSFLNENLNQVWRQNLLDTYPGINDSFTSNIVRDLELNTRLNSGLNIGSSFYENNIIKNSLIDTAKSIVSPLSTPLISDLRTNSALFNPAIEMANAITGHREDLRMMGLLGQHISRPIDISIVPKYSSDLVVDSEQNEIRVEAIIGEDKDIHPTAEVDDEDDEMELNDSEASYAFDIYPLTVTITHHPDSKHSRKTQHKIRKPTDDEWYQWGLDLERTRRYWTPEEISEENSKKREDEEDSTEIWNDFYSEWNAAEKLYDMLLLEVAGYKIDKTDEFPLEEFRELSPELIKKIQYQTKELVTSDLYECYCWLQSSTNLGADQRLIRQKIDRKSKSYLIDHILRRPTKQESYDFRTQIIKASFSKDEENREIIVLKLNLRAAADLYNQLLIKIERATLAENNYREETRTAFLQEINPVYKLRVLEPLLNINAWKFDVDNIVIN